MTTKYLTGTYASGYCLSPAYSGLKLRPGAAVSGSGADSGHAAFIAKYGKVEATPHAKNPNYWL